MEKSPLPVWFLGTVLLAHRGAGGVQRLRRAHYILGHPAGGSVQTLSGFERALKPVWLEQVQPELVFVGSSRVRDGFRSGPDRSGAAYAQLQLWRLQHVAL